MQRTYKKVPDRDCLPSLNQRWRLFTSTFQDTYIRYIINLFSITDLHTLCIDRTNPYKREFPRHIKIVLNDNEIHVMTVGMKVNIAL